MHDATQSSSISVVNNTWIFVEDQSIHVQIFTNFNVLKCSLLLMHMNYDFDTANVNRTVSEQWGQLMGYVPYLIIILINIVMYLFFISFLINL